MRLTASKSIFRTSGYVNGNWVAEVSGGTFNVLNPASGKVIASLPAMDAGHVEEASAAAFTAWKGWKIRTCKERSAVIGRMADLMKTYSGELAEIITLESGKPLAEAKGEVNYALSFYEYYAEEAKRMRGDVLPHPVNGRRLMAVKESVGPAGIITPWNFPSAMITRKAGAALAAGCSVVIKPSEETPLSALALCAIAEEAGLPAGVMNCLPVARAQAADVGEALCKSADIRKVSFTGSTPVGKTLLRHCADGVKKVSMELGGNAPFLIFDDADLDVAVSALMAAKFRNAGQACIAANRILVQRGVVEELTEKLVTKVRKLKCGDGMEAGTSMGPLINAGGLAKVQRQVASCLEAGAKAAVGGAVSANLNAAGGTYFQPTVLTGVTRDMAPFSEETFGPVAPITVFDTYEEAVEIANDTPFGLAAYACTRDLARAFSLSEDLDAGMVGINEGAISSELAPFGGVKESGLGREGSYNGMDEYCEVKYVCFGLGKDAK